jgi:pimeloyl-[acyl-carrier protein] methyl ester esterase
MGCAVSSDRLIFISGWATDSSSWNSIIEKIGRPVSCRHVNWWECLNDPVEGNALVRNLEQEKGDAIIVGWSLGTLTALEGFACGPHHVKALVLISGTPRITSQGSYPGADSKALKAMSARFGRTPRLVLEEFARRCIDDGRASSPGTDEFVDTFVEKAGRIGTDHLSAGLRYLQERDLRRMLPEISIPVSMLHGDCDRIIPVDCARYMQTAIPKARLDEVRGGSHALLHTAPFQVAGFIRDAIDANFDSQ